MGRELRFPWWGADPHTSTADQSRESMSSSERDSDKKSQSSDSAVHRHFERQKMLSDWMGSIVEKLMTCSRETNLDLYSLPEQVMADMTPSESLPFKHILRSEIPSDIPFYFLVCSQLTYEGKIIMEPGTKENGSYIDDASALRITRIEPLSTKPNLRKRKTTSSAAGDASKRKIKEKRVTIEPTRRSPRIMNQKKPKYV